MNLEVQLNGRKVTVQIKRRRLTDHVRCRHCGWVGHQYPQPGRRKFCTACGSRDVRTSHVRSRYAVLPQTSEEMNKAVGDALERLRQRRESRAGTAAGAHIATKARD